MKKYRIFISYRRAGGEDFARAVYQELKHKKYRVFLDRQDLESGDYEKQVMAVISDCTDVVLILPPHALDRCSEENDLFRKEIAMSLQQQKNLIPIIRNGFEFPPIETLPEEIQALPKQEAIVETPESYDGVVRRLKELLDRSAKAYQKQKFQKIGKRVGKLSLGLVLTVGVIAGGFGIAKVIRNQNTIDTAQIAIRSNNNLAERVVTPNSFFQQNVPDYGHLQDVFLGQTLTELQETLGLEKNSAWYHGNTLEYTLYFVGDATSFPYSGDFVQLGVTADEKQQAYGAVAIFLIENNKVIHMRYALAVPDESAARKLMKIVYQNCDNGNGVMDEENNIYTISDVRSCNGNLNLSCSKNDDGVMRFLYDLSNGMEIPSYFSQVTTETETYSEPIIEILPYQNTEYHNYYYNDTVRSTYRLTDVKVDLTDEKDGKFKANIEIYGKKKADFEGDQRLDSLDLNVQLMDESGNVIDTRLVMASRIAVGEKFKESISFFDKIEGGHTYQIKIEEKNE